MSFADLNAVDVSSTFVLLGLLLYVTHRPREQGRRAVRKGSPVYDRRAALESADVARFFKGGGS